MLKELAKYYKGLKSKIIAVFPSLILDNRIKFKNQSHLTEFTVRLWFLVNFF